MARRLVRGCIVGRDGRVVDEVLAAFMPGPHSYTGEDVLELHTHGGEVAPRLVLRACLALGARVAAPGEFTRRAFETGRLDLAQVSISTSGIGGAGFSLFPMVGLDVLAEPPTPVAAPCFGSTWEGWLCDSILKMMAVPS